MTGLKIFGLGIVAIVILAGFAIFGNLAETAASVVSAPGRVVQKTLRTDNIISNYEWFKQQNQDVIAIDKRLEASRQALADFETSAGPRDGWKFDDRQEWNRLNTVIRGLEGKRADMVAEYNARSEMMNRAIFKDHNLPERLN